MTQLHTPANDTWAVHTVQLCLPANSEWRVLVPGFVGEAADAPADAIDTLKKMLAASPVETWLAQIHTTDHITTLEIKE